MNALLVPDQRSLTSRSRPYDWTWHDGTTVDDVASQIHAGMQRVIDDLCANEWQTPVPAPGRVPESERPNLFVMLPVPAMLDLGDTLLVPVFSSRERARLMAQRIPELSHRIAAGDHELVEARSTADYAGSEAILLSFSGIQASPDVTLRVCLDPEPQDRDWRRITAKAGAECVIAELLADDMKIVGVPVDAPMTVYVWRAPFLVT